MLKKELLQSGCELAPEDATQRSDGQEESSRGGDPSGTVGSKTASRNNVMDVWMMLKVLSHQDQHYGRRRARSLGAAAVTKENRPPNTRTVSTRGLNRSRKPSVYREEWAAFGDAEPSASFGRISES